MPLGKAPVGGLGAEAFFVNECLNFDVLKKIVNYTTKNTIIKNWAQVKGEGQAQDPINTPLYM